MVVQDCSWCLFDEGAKSIAEWAKKQKFDGIYGIPRGGLVLGVKLSHLLNVPLYKTPYRGKKVLVVDDIADSGKTLRQYKELGDFKIATLYYNKKSTTTPDKYVYEKVSDWVAFPWEKVHS